VLLIQCWQWAATFFITRSRTTISLLFVAPPPFGHARHQLHDRECLYCRSDSAWKRAANFGLLALHSLLDSSSDRRSAAGSAHTTTSPFHVAAAMSLPTRLLGFFRAAGITVHEIAGIRLASANPLGALQKRLPAAACATAGSGGGLGGFRWMRAPPPLLAYCYLKFHWTRPSWHSVDVHSRLWRSLQVRLPWQSTRRQINSG